MCERRTAASCSKRRLTHPGHHFLIVRMIRTLITKNILTMLLLAWPGGAAFARQIAPSESSEPIIPFREIDTQDATEVIFSNLDSSPDNRYNSDPFFAWPV